MSPKAHPRQDETDWQAVIARALSAVALGQREDLRDAPLGDRAIFLECIGLPRADIAMLLGSTEESIRKTLERVKKGGSKGAKKAGKQ